MRRIVSNFFISLDGVVEAPDQWHFPYFDEEMGQVVQAGMSSATSMLLGRRGYDEWPPTGRTSRPTTRSPPT